MEQYRLNGFTDYQDFLNYAEPLFHLKPEENKELESLIHRIQEDEKLGWGPVQTMTTIAAIEQHDFPNFAKFLVMVRMDQDLGEIVFEIMNDAEKKRAEEENRLPQ